MLSSKDAQATSGDSAQTKAKPGVLSRFARALRSTLSFDLGTLFGQHRVIDETLFEEIESLLLTADVGVESTQRLIDGLTRRLARKELDDGEAVRNALCEDMLDILAPVGTPLEVKRPAGGTFVILMVGVNGTGKTTTIGKLAHRYKAAGHSVMLAAGDTFRAAAVEQLQVWGERNDVPVTAQHSGADSASVIFDALQSAQARKMDILIADTAGRLHTQGGLMEELKKVSRVVGKLDDTAPHETMLVLDATIGQNALNQAREFHEAVKVSGITLTKLDGTAKGGMVFAIADRVKLPIRFVGVGEGIDDLRPFSAEEFVHALVDQR
jgi:fused signal recognition particle receptor